MFLQQLIAQTPGKKIDLSQNLKLSDFTDNHRQLLAAGIDDTSLRDYLKSGCFNLLRMCSVINSIATSFAFLHISIHHLHFMRCASILWLKGSCSRCDVRGIPSIVASSILFGIAKS